MAPPSTPSKAPLAQALHEAARRALQALKGLRRPHAIVGAVALWSYGTPRATADVDFMVFGDPADLERLEPLARRFGLRLDKAWRLRNPGPRHIAVRYRYRGIPVDFLRPRDRHEEGLPRRLMKTRVAGRTCSVLRPEDYVLLKAKAGRDRDFADAIRVALKYLDKMDYRYLRSWSIRAGVFEEVQYVIATAERGES